MSYDIIIGRDAADKKAFGDRGLIYLGKGFVKMGTYTSLSNKLWMDVARSHVVLIAGKRGAGKSYSLGVIAEELSNLPAENAQNIASVIFDTMGIFWTMKYENEKEKLLLNSWDLTTKKLLLNIIVPSGKSTEYAAKNIPFDATFELQASELNTEDWIALFNLEFTHPASILIERSLASLQEHQRTFALNDITKAIDADTQAKAETKEIAKALFAAANTWGIFSKKAEGTKINDLIKAGATTVFDISAYSSVAAFNVRALIISILSRKMFNERLDARKKEELDAIHHGQEYLSYGNKRQQPLLWIFIDEAHEFLPKEGKTPATDALIQLLREGRQPGISLVLATQQPGQIHRDAMSQADIVIAHRVTAKQDVLALNEIMQTYLLENIQQQMNELPSLKGAALILDDNSERIYPMRMRPRLTWHGGEAPSSVKTEIKF